MKEVSKLKFNIFSRENNRLSKEFSQQTEITLLKLNLLSSRYEWKKIMLYYYIFLSFVFIQMGSIYFGAWIRNIFFGFTISNLWDFTYVGIPVGMYHGFIYVFFPVFYGIFLYGYPEKIPLKASSSYRIVLMALMVIPSIIFGIFAFRLYEYLRNSLLRGIHFLGMTYWLFVIIYLVPLLVYFGYSKRYTLYLIYQRFKIKSSPKFTHFIKEYIHLSLSRLPTVIQQLEPQNVDQILSNLLKQDIERLKQILQINNLPVLSESILIDLCLQHLNSVRDKIHEILRDYFTEQLLNPNVTVNHVTIREEILIPQINKIISQWESTRKSDT